MKRRHTILLVDDEMIHLQALQLLFQYDYSLYTASNGKEALELFEKQYKDISLILCDQKMPQMNGIEFLTHTRKISPDTIRILMTNYSKTDILIDSINRADIYKFLPKSISNRQLQITVERALEAYELKSENKTLIQELKLANNRLDSEVTKRTQELEVSLAELQKVNRLKSQIFSVITHDFRAPLGNLRNFLELLVDDELQKEEIEELSKEMMEKLDLTSNLLENLLSWATTHLKNETQKHSAIQLYPFFHELLQFFSAELATKEIHPELFIPESIKIHFDSEILLIISRNILSNSIKFTPRKGKISIRITEDMDYTNIHFQDSGIGMERETIQRIQNHIRNQSKLGTNREIGSGVGLILCKELLLRCKGKMQIFSETGLGTEIIIQIPHSQSFFE